jgi:hypothetical protein
VKNILVVLDGGSISRQAAYTAYDVAARTGSKLIGAALMALQGQENAEQTLNEFMIGARAAGVGVTGDYFPSLADAWLAFENILIDAVFIAQNCLENENVLADWSAQGKCPLWIIPEQRDIHRSLVFYDLSPAAPTALRSAMDLAEQLRLDLTLFVAKDGILLDEILPIHSQTGIKLTLQSSQISDSETLFRQIAANKIDLAFIGIPEDQELLRELCQGANCLLVICPMLNSL